MTTKERKKLVKCVDDAIDKHMCDWISDMFAAEKAHLKDRYGVEASFPSRESVIADVNRRMRRLVP